MLGVYRDYSNLDGKLRLTLSDGKYSHDCAILAFDNFGKWKQVVEYCIIRVIKYQYEEIKGKKFIIIESYDIITINWPKNSQNKIIGNPAPMNQDEFWNNCNEKNTNSSSQLKTPPQLKIENLQKVVSIFEKSVSTFENTVGTLNEKLKANDAEKFKPVKKIEEEDNRTSTNISTTHKHVDEILQLKIENLKLNHQLEKLSLEIASVVKNNHGKKDSK